VFSPTKDTFIKAINNNSFLTWPGLTLKLISKHLLPSIATHSGLLRQEKQGLHSIKSLAMTATAANISQATDDFFPKFDPKDPRCMLRHVSNHRLDAFHINPAEAMNIFSLDIILTLMPFMVYLSRIVKLQPSPKHGNNYITSFKLQELHQIPEF